MNLVDCKSCDHWDFELELKRVCEKCNNTRKVRDPKKFLCNLCGECVCPIGTDSEQYPHGLFEAKVFGGYYSAHLLDLNAYIFSFCEKCLRDLFIKCKIKPKIYNCDVDENFRKEVSWESDQKQYEFEMWIKGGDRERAFINGKCNFAKDCANDAIYSLLINDHPYNEISCEEHKDLYKNVLNAKLIPFERKNK